MKKALFFDLQGTLGGEFLGDIRDFEFYSMSVEALKLAKDNDYYVFVITNQSRIAKGHLSMAEYKLRRDKIIEELEMNDVHIDGFECCPHDKGECNCKKPKPGMIDAILNKFDIDLKNSYVIGDLGGSDMLLADNIGSKSILVLTGGGKGSMNEYRHVWSDIEPTFVAEDVLDAVKLAIS